MKMFFQLGKFIQLLFCKVGGGFLYLYMLEKSVFQQELVAFQNTCLYYKQLLQQQHTNKRHSLATVVDRLCMLMGRVSFITVSTSKILVGIVSFKLLLSGYSCRSFTRLLANIVGQTLVVHFPVPSASARSFLIGTSLPFSFQPWKYPSRSNNLTTLSSEKLRFQKEISWARSHGTGGGMKLGNEFEHY